MHQIPFTFDLQPGTWIPTAYDQYIRRHLSQMAGQYLDEPAYQALLDQEDLLLYEVYSIQRPEIIGELLSGISIIHPGQVGAEYFMTKGHYHAVLETAEVYYCLQGQGFMVMETPEGAWSVAELAPGKVLYVLPRWAHRAVNTSKDEDLVFFFVYPAHAGHDYGTIEAQGFRKRIVEEEGQPVFIDNPRWQMPAGS